jgi:predicted HNH restriction endonuclease
VETSALGLGEIRTVKPSGEYRCVCVATHRPPPAELHAHHVFPLGEGGPDTKANLIYICPTSHASAHKLWRLMDKHDGNLTTAQKSEFTRSVRKIVDTGWAQKKAESTDGSAS